jgi:hypothetical protein
VVLVPLDVDAPAAAVERARRALTGTGDAAPRAAAMPVGARITQEPATRVAVAATAAALVGDAPRAERSGSSARPDATSRAPGAAAVRCRAGPRCTPRAERAAGTGSPVPACAARHSPARCSARAPVLGGPCGAGRARSGSRS